MDWINEHIAASNQLWVTYTDPAGKWDWPLYEAGIFTGLNQAEADQTKLLCFYRDPRDKPDALANYEGVQLRADELRVFLIIFFGDKVLRNNQCISATAAENEEIIQSIIDAILPKFAAVTQAEPTLYNKYINMEFSYHGSNVEEENIKTASITTVSVIADIFARTKLTENWGKLLDYADSSRS